ncbi:MAG: HEPN domain-containing protein [Promethearchaeota archaeon]
MNRVNDWLEQARRDLAHARESIKIKHYDWAVLAAQQGAEKAIKALYYQIGADPWGHAILQFLKKLPKKINISADLIESARYLDKHYITSRYPNGFASGAPKDYYTEKDAEEALKHGEKIFIFCENQISCFTGKIDGNIKS